MIIDVRTLILLHFIVNVINLGAIAIILPQYRHRFAGISLWFWCLSLHAAGAGLILLRGSLPDIITIVLSNTILLVGTTCLFIGLEQFVAQNRSHRLNFIALVLLFCFLYYFNKIQPNLAAREFIVSLTGIFLYFQIAWLLLYRTPHTLRPITQIAGYISIGYILVSIFRILLTIPFPLKNNDLFQSNQANSITITLYLALNICLTIALILMVNRRLLNEVQVQEEKFTKVFHSAPYAILLTRPADGKIFEANEGFLKITGYDLTEVLGKTTLDLNLWVKKEDRNTVVKTLAMKKKIEGLEYQFHIKSGEVITGLYSADTILINNEEFILSSISDITELSQIKQQLQIEATHDHMTGLPNRKLFFDRFNIARANAQRYKKSLAIMSLDLDEFKTINDTFGHDVGDQVLVDMTRRLTVGLRRGDTVARFGGDEFVLLLTEIKSREDASEIAQKILHAFQAAFRMDENEFNLSASIGIALYPQDGKTINDLIKKSDLALYQVKKNGKNNYYFYCDLPENGLPDYSEDLSE